MGTGRTCEVCSELASLLSSYDGKRTTLTSFEDITISREEVETIILYLSSWSQRQCSCCFRSDHKHFERFNWALQLLILIVVEIVQRFGTSPPSSQESSSSTSSRPLWDCEDKDKLVYFVAKLFTNSFPTYIGYKTHSGAGIKLSDSELSAAELHNLSQYCEINEPEASPYLFRNVGLFCRAGGMEALTVCLQNNTPDSLALHRMNMLVALASNVKSWLNFNALLKLYVPFRAAALGYMCSLVETELKTGSARNMAECIWSSVKDPVDVHLSFDKDGLDLAFRYFLCPTLTMRLAGVNQLNNYINLFNELLNSEHMRDPDRLYDSLCAWLLTKQVVEHIFGPNLHVEVIKQSHTILSFLAMENRLTEEHVEIIWTAAQLKHCSKPVFDVLSSLIPHMEPGPVLHLHHLLQKLEPKDHSEQSLYLASALIKFIWTNATSAMEEANALTTSLPLGSGDSVVSVPTSSSSPSNNNLQFHHARADRRHHHHHHQRGRRRPIVADVSSSENSVSVDGSEEEDEENHHHHHRRHHHRVQAQRLLRPLSQMETDDEEEEPLSPTSSFLKPTCHLSGSSSSDESLSDEEDEDEDDDGIRSEKGGCSSGGGGGGGSTPYVETHSDSDADEDEPENEVLGGKIIIKKRKVLRRKANTPVKNVAPTKGRVIMTPSSTPRVTKMVQSNKSVSNTSSQGQGDQKLQQVPDPSPSTSTDAVVPTSKTPMTIYYPLSGTTCEVSDGSYSSRISTKSDKNMADFDATRGQNLNLTPQQLQPQYVQQQLLDPNIVLTVGGVQIGGSNNGRNKTQLGPGSGGGGGSTTLLLPPRAMRMFFRRKRFGSMATFNFKIDDVIEPGVTLLWDLIQDDKIVQLSDGLAIEAQKALTNLLCFGADKAIRLKFIEGCIRNVGR
ncbi:Ubiquitin carboxyl-terminal hydrolase 34 [Folsomia candida]|uniref:Ubiquitin carboxyl-terminal hydrolase 34 n=1 Tax=Folsomia candida TaxID=158441 RepID=A0A226D9D3_FOLCA|nr:Ubiquitin carboxyl-terminal hydrolase 34 [Folsomia candida]